MQPRYFQVVPVNVCVQVFLIKLYIHKALSSNKIKYFAVLIRNHLLPCIKFGTLSFFYFLFCQLPPSNMYLHNLRARL